MFTTGVDPLPLGHELLRSRVPSVLKGIKIVGLGVTVRFYPPDSQVVSMKRFVQLTVAILIKVTVRNRAL